MRAQTQKRVQKQTEGYSKRMLAALKEYTLDVWDLLVGNKYPRKIHLQALTELSKKQKTKPETSFDKSLSTSTAPPIVRQPTLLGWTEEVPSGSASVCITLHPHHHEEF